MATIRKIKKDGGLPDYYYVMPNQDRIDIMVIRPEIYETLDEVRAAAKKWEQKVFGKWRALELAPRAVGGLVDQKLTSTRAYCPHLTSQRRSAR